MRPPQGPDTALKLLGETAAVHSAAPAQAYVVRNQAEETCRMEALSCLKRHLAGVVDSALKEIRVMDRTGVGDRFAVAA